MTAPAIETPTGHRRLNEWVREVADLTSPTGSSGATAPTRSGPGSPTRSSTPARWSGSTRTKKPNSFWARTDPSDVARVEDRTFICSRRRGRRRADEQLDGPAEMKAMMTDLYRGCMRGRTMYVIPFCMGPLDADAPMFGVEITDSAYVVARCGS